MVPTPTRPLDALDFYWRVLDGVSEQCNKGPEYETVLSYFVPAAPRAEFVQRIFQDSNDEKKIAHHAVNVRHMIRIRDSWPWEILVQGFDERLRNTNQAPPDIEHLIHILLLLDVVAHYQRASTCLRNLAQGGYLAHYLNGARSNPAAVAKYLFVIVRSGVQPS